MSITIRISRATEGPNVPAPGFVGAMGGVKPGRRVEDELEVSIDTDAASALEAITAAAAAFSLAFPSGEVLNPELEGPNVCADSCQEDSGAEAQASDPEPGDAVWVEFDDGSAGTYIYDGETLHHPAHTVGCTSATQYKLNDKSIKSISIIARFRAGDITLDKETQA